MNEMEIVDALVGKTIVGVDYSGDAVYPPHLTLTFGDGSVVRIESSEWLTIMAAPASFVRELPFPEENR